MNRADELNQVMQLCYLCEECPSLVKSRKTEAWGKPVFGKGFIDAPFMLIGEAPGRLGAARTGIPFKGDKSGDFLEWCLEELGIQHDSLYITNIVKCLPKDENENNRKPTAYETSRCIKHLIEEIRIVNPEKLICLGRTAYKTIIEKSQWYPDIRKCEIILVDHPSYVSNYQGGKPGTPRAQKYVEDLAEAMSIDCAALRKETK